jgi:hypothetical protein
MGLALTGLALKTAATVLRTQFYGARPVQSGISLEFPWNCLGICLGIVLGFAWDFLWG